MIDRPKPPFYELEFSSDATFWTEGDAITRRVYLMPVSTPSEFLAFGVLAPSYAELSTVVFVARGRVREELGSFISRMVQDGAIVELFIWPPLPMWLVNEYVKGPPYEGKEYDDPPPPPINGLVPVPGDTTEYEPTGGGTLWTAGDASSRRAILVPVRDPAEFLAFGVLGSEDTVYFALRGTVKDELGNFIAQMTREVARVELYARPKQLEGVLHKYLSEQDTGTASPQDKPGR